MDDIALQQAQTAYMALESIPSLQLNRMDKEVRDQINLARSNIALAVDRMRNPRPLVEINGKLNVCPDHKVPMIPRVVQRNVRILICPKDDCAKWTSI